MQTLGGDYVKVIKRILLVLAIIALTIVCFPKTTYAATSFVVDTIYVIPGTLAEKGGEADLIFKIKNTGTVDITNITYGYYLNSGFKDGSISTTISPDAIKSFSVTIDFKEGDLGALNDITIWATTSEDSIYQNAVFIVYSEDNVIRSDGNVDPEKTTYYVGESVYITDTMRNSLTFSVTNATMQYYFRDENATYDGEKVSFGTISANERVGNILEYTFTEEDVGELRIGSYITYYVSGKGPYKEYNVAHDFVVEPFQTQSPTHETTKAVTPEPINEPTQEIETTDEPQLSIEEKEENQNSFKDMYLNTEENDKGKGEEDNRLDESIFNDKTIIMTIIIIIGVIVVALIILVITIIYKRKKVD
jgi:hypothetical protein